MIFFPPSDSDDALELDELHSPVLFHIMKYYKMAVQEKGKDKQTEESKS